MRLKLPAKNAEPNPQNLTALRDGLTSVIAGHPGAIDMWTFYEEIDAYLGPWGDNGYPIGYGKYYCKLFNENDKLKRDPGSSEWVRRTMIALQEALRDFIVERFRRRTLATLTQAELAHYAFSTHARVYNDSGLSKIVLVSPELLPVILSIPGKEFNPCRPELYRHHTTGFRDDGASDAYCLCRQLGGNDAGALRLSPPGCPAGCGRSGAGIPT